MSYTYKIYPTAADLATQEERGKRCHEYSLGELAVGLGGRGFVPSGCELETTANLVVNVKNIFIINNGLRLEVYDTVPMLCVANARNELYMQFVYDVSNNVETFQFNAVTDKSVPANAIYLGTVITNDTICTKTISNDRQQVPASASPKIIYKERLWTVPESLPTLTTDMRYRVAGNDKIYVVNNGTSKLDYFDMKLFAWVNSVCDVPAGVLTASDSNATVFYQDGFINYLLRGTSPSLRLHRYHIETDTWFEITMPSGTISLQGGGTVTWTAKAGQRPLAIVDHYIYTISRFNGLTDEDPYPYKVFRYDVWEDTWLALLGELRGRFTASSTGYYYNNYSYMFSHPQMLLAYHLYPRLIGGGGGTWVPTATLGKINITDGTMITNHHQGLDNIDFPALNSESSERGGSVVNCGPYVYSMYQTRRLQYYSNFVITRHHKDSLVENVEWYPVEVMRTTKSRSTGSPSYYSVMLYPLSDGNGMLYYDLPNAHLSTRKTNPEYGSECSTGLVCYCAYIKFYTCTSASILSIRKSSLPNSKLVNITSWQTGKTVTAVEGDEIGIEVNEWIGSTGKQPYCDIEVEINGGTNYA